MKLFIPFPGSLMLCAALLLSACSSPETTIKPVEPVVPDGAASGQIWKAQYPTLENSRALAGALGKRLVGELQSAMADKGPLAAINVCRNRAPEIALELSRRSGATVGRTSRQYRNPLNAPEAWQEMVLTEYFHDTVAETEMRVEYFAASESGGVQYMQAIRLGGVCVTCHGQNISSQVSNLLDQHYPQDLARGYAPGDLRGAFTVSWPSAEAL